MSNITVRPRKENAFTLVEVMLAILVVGILAAIAVPIFLSQQRDVQSAAYKTDLVATAALIEQEAIDNNGLYPTYLPNEVKNNPRTKAFIYSYTGERTSYCIQANTPVGKFYVSSTDSKKVIETSCTLEYLADGTTAPWDAPNISNPPAPTVNLSWPVANAGAQGTATIPAQTCTLSSADQAKWGSTIKLTYRYILTNFDRGGASSYTDWAASPTANLNSKLTGFWPGERVQVQAQIKCIIGDATDFAYQSKPGPATLVTVPDFQLNAPVLVTNTATWFEAAGQPNMRVNTSWNSLTCPIGTPAYDYDARSTTDGTYFGEGSSADASNTTPFVTSGSLASTNGFNTNGRVTVDLVVRCVMPNGKIISSPKTSAALTAALNPPARPGNLSTSYVSGSINPSRVHWPAVTCSVGTPQYLLENTNGSYSSGWITNLYADPSLTAGTSHSFTTKARCVLNTISSPASAASNVLTFTPEYSIPPTPSAPTNLGNSASGSATYTNNMLTWNHVTCANNSQPVYQVRQTMKNGAAIAEAQRPNSGNFTITNNNYSIPNAWLQAGSTVQFEVAAKCRGIGGDSSASAYASSAGSKWTTNIPGTTSVRSASVNRAGAVTWAAPTTACPAGTTTEYRVHNNGWDGLTTGTSINAGNWENLGGNSYTVWIAAKCKGPNANSAESSGVSASITIPWTQARTTDYGNNCSNFRAGPGTGHAVWSCRWGNEGPLNVYNVCNANGYTWGRTDWGWTTTQNLQNVSTANIRYGC